MGGLEMTRVEAQRDLERNLDDTFGLHIQAVCERTAQALERCDYTGLLVHAGELLTVFEDDRTYPFQANAPFKVWVPRSDAPGSFVWFNPGAMPRLIIERPQDYWHKPTDLPQGYWVPHFEVHAVTDRAAARKLLPPDLSRAAYIGDAFDGLGDFGLGALNPRPLMRRLDYARAAKTPYELVALREANRLGALGHVAAASAFAAGASEFEIELAFLKACGLREQELPYNPIIALNASGSVLHYQVLEKEPPPERHSLLIDAGAEFAGYASDITRTYSRVDQDFSALIARMDQMQQALCAGVRAGVDWRDVQLRAHELTAEVLREADLIRCSAADAVSSGVTRIFLPHGIGHLLGLEVHDVGGFMRTAEGGEIGKPEGHPYLRMTRVLEPGFVVTMEPGIYFIPQLLEAARADGRGRHINWARVQALARFGGVRIEDDLAVTASGCENLTRDAFRAVSS
jgi:Xaa-Pro dipeptidase